MLHIFQRCTTEWRALYANGGNIELENVQFNNNEAAKGGALYNGSFSQNLTLDKVKFSNNIATDGSAIYNLGSVTVTDAVFENNLQIIFIMQRGNSYNYFCW